VRETMLEHIRASIGKADVALPVPALAIDRADSEPLPSDSVLMNVCHVSSPIG